MKILIVSDTHGREYNLETVLEKVGKFDFFIHLGDLEDAEAYIRLLIGNVQLAMVAGNNDYYSTDLSEEAVFSLKGHRIMITHGHTYYVNRGVEYLVKAAREKDADIVMYGHTHRPDLQYVDGVTVLNPGSLTLPRQAGRKPTWAIMEIDEKKNVSIQFYSLDGENVNLYEI